MRANRFAFHALLLVWLYYAGGYIDDRHLMPIVALALPTAGAGTVLLAAWICKWARR
jgi:hypothetical protein